MFAVNLKMEMFIFYLTAQFHAGSIKEKVFDAFGKFARKLLIANEMNEHLADPPIHVRFGFYF